MAGIDVEKKDLSPSSQKKYSTCTLFDLHWDLQVYISNFNYFTPAKKNAISNWAVEVTNIQKYFILRRICMG